MVAVVVISTETHHQRAVLVVVVEQQAKRGRLEIHQAQAQAKEILAAHLMLLHLLWVAGVERVRLVQMAHHQLAVMVAMELRHQ